jgi:hypothetical protein
MQSMTLGRRKFYACLGTALRLLLVRKNRLSGALIACQTV